MPRHKKYNPMRHLYLFIINSILWLPALKAQTTVPIGFQHSEYTFHAPPGISAGFHYNHHQITGSAETWTWNTDHGVGLNYSYFLDSIHSVTQSPIKPFLSIRPGYYYRRYFISGGNFAPPTYFSNVHFSLGSNISIWRNLVFTQQAGLGYSLIHTLALSGDHKDLIKDKLFMWGIIWEFGGSSGESQIKKYSLLNEMKSPSTPLPLSGGDFRSSLSVRIGLAPRSFSYSGGLLTGVYYNYRFSKRASVYLGLEAQQDSSRFDLESPLGRAGVQYHVPLLPWLSYYLDAGMGMGYEVYHAEPFFAFKIDWGNMLRINPKGLVFFDAGFHHSFNYLASPYALGGGRLVTLEVGTGVNFGKVKPRTSQ